jgi:membrane protein YqaA with SNARE-associated domain
VPLLRTQVAQNRPKRNWRTYLIIISLVALFIVVPVVALVYFKEEIQQAEAYGYAGVFVVGLLCGITIIPAPTQLLIFTFGNVLKPLFGFGPDYVGPLYVGVVAGLGSAIGGITVYLTGAGVQTIWSKLRNREQAFEHRLGLSDEVVRPVESELLSKFLSKGKAFYNRLVKWLSGKGGAWVVFFTSAIVISPFYPAGLAAGSLRMGLVKFFLVSWAGRTVRYLYVAYAGYWGFYFLLKWFGA